MRAVLTSFHVEAHGEDGPSDLTHVYLVADLETGQVTATTDPGEAYNQDTTASQPTGAKHGPGSSAGGPGSGSSQGGGS